MKCECGHDERDHRMTGACVALVGANGNTTSRGPLPLMVCGCNDYAALPDNTEGR